MRSALSIWLALALAGCMGNGTVNNTTAGTTFSSMYNAMQVKFNRRFTGGLLITTSYTWAKGMGYQDGDDGGLLFGLGDRLVEPVVGGEESGPEVRRHRRGEIREVVGGFRPRHADA